MVLGNPSAHLPQDDSSQTTDKQNLSAYTITEWREWMNKARLAGKHKRYVESERYYQQAMDVAESGGQGHVQWWDTLLEWSDLLRLQEKYVQSEPLLMRGWEYLESLDDAHREQRFSIACRLAAVLHKQSKYNQAEPFYYRALKDLQAFAGPNHPQTMVLLGQLGNLYTDLRNYERAEKIYLRILDWTESTLGKYHPKRAAILDRMAAIMRISNRKAKAEAYRIEASQIRSKKGKTLPSLSS